MKLSEWFIGETGKLSVNTSVLKRNKYFHTPYGSSCASYVLPENRIVAIKGIVYEGCRKAKTIPGILRGLFPQVEITKAEIENKNGSPK